MTSSRLIRERNDLLARLRRGTPRQKLAARVFQALLPEFPPELGRPFPAGTIPLDVDLPDSDLDIVAEVSSGPETLDALRARFGGHQEYRAHIRREDGAMVCAFRREELMVEIFGASMPVESQNAYRHMKVEGRLLELAGPAARAEIRRLKQEGLKTEPAFARCFALKGDPYALLYELYHASTEELRALTTAAGYSP